MNINSELHPKQYPIAVYQMGKVGSESILYSLGELNLPHPIYHIHVLSPQKLANSINHLKSQQRPLTLQLQHSKILRQYLDDNPNPPVKIISGVREPISQLVSAWFQNLKAEFPQFIDSKGQLKTEQIKKYIENMIINYDPTTAWNCNWFDQDFKPALDIDIYQFPFNHDLGYVSFKKDNIDVLVLRLENSRNWGRILGDFLGLNEPVKIIKRNIAEDKIYKDVYNEITEDLKFSDAVLDKIYASKYCQHFYCSELLKNFYLKWKI